MKKLLFLIGICLFGGSLFAQTPVMNAPLKSPGYVELNGSYSFDKTFHIFDQSVYSLTAGFNYNIDDRFYAGLGVGFSMVSADYEGIDKDLFTITPKCVYYLDMGEGFYWTPEFYIGLGFGSKDLTISPESVMIDAPIDAIIKYTNIRIGLNLLSFDYRFDMYDGWLKNLAVNFNIFTPYYNIMVGKYSDDYIAKPFEKTFGHKASYNGMVMLGANIGIKYHLINK